MDQSDAGSARDVSARTNRMQEVREYAHDGPMRCRKCGNILTMGQSDAGSARGVDPRSPLGGTPPGRGRPGRRRPGGPGGPGGR
eukprot:1179205-Prorocentrum_minimum.AAC.7